MFTGIITEVGAVRTIARAAQGLNVTVAAPQTAPRLRVGDSVCVHGVCLTAEREQDDAFVASVMAETASKTTLGKLRPASRVNLELPLTLNDPVGGHLVAGHVDAVGTVSAREQRGESVLLTVLAPQAVQPYLAPRGSVAVDGVSLTIAETAEASFTVSLVRHTLDATTLGDLRPGDEVNLEGDLLARYLERLLEYREGRVQAQTDVDGLTLDKLGEGGYL
ncbi:MAG: riboflavin synthase [Armatimonadota bacterium]|nr:MAG: riboflavin synthase [Armatimonadota bacterium]